MRHLFGCCHGAGVNASLSYEGEGLITSLDG